MKQLNLEDYIKEQSQNTEEKKPDWVNSSYEPIKIGDLVRYHFGVTEDKKSVGLVVAVVPSNVYDSSMCDILDNDGSKRTVKTTWVRKIT